VDISLLDSLRSPHISEPLSHHRPRKARAHPGTHEGWIEFCTPSLDRFSQKSERLNDVIINSGALLLQHIFSQERFSQSQAQACAIFSSFDIHIARYNRDLASTWERTEANLFWQKPIWLFPIHRNDPFKHWVLCVVYPSLGRVYAYNSLASDLTAWREDLEVSGIVSMSILAADTPPRMCDFSYRNSAWRLQNTENPCSCAVLMNGSCSRWLQFRLRPPLSAVASGSWRLLPPSFEAIMSRVSGNRTLQNSERYCINGL
jgi:hypothetical protein